MMVTSIIPPKFTGGWSWLSNLASTAVRSLMRNLSMRKTGGEESLSGSALGDVGTYRVRNCRRKRLSISSVLAVCAASSLMRLQVNQSMSRLASIADHACGKDERKRFKATMRIANQNWFARRAGSLSFSQSALFDRVSTVGSTAPVSVSTLIEKVRASRSILQLRKGLERLMLRDTSCSKLERDGHVNIVTLWRCSWADLFMPGSPSITKTATAQTTIRPTWNCGSKPSRQAFAWRMWPMSMGLSWWPHDSAFENSNFNFHIVRPKLLASFGVSQVGLIPKEAS